MFSTPAEVLAFIKSEGVRHIDVRFCDLPGQMQHFSVPAAIVDESFFMVLNAHGETIEWAVPPSCGERWRVVFDTNDPARDDAELSADEPLHVEGNAVVLLVRLDG